MRWRRALRPLWLGAWLVAAPLVGQHPAAPLPSPLEPASTGGLAAVDRALAQLSGHRRLLVIGAHPDDEDNALLAFVTHALGGEAGYLSLSRGEGGQNLIGTELGVGLGVLRTGELLAAREVDGAWQFFARGYDFGYTRSLDETFARWPRELLQEDAVRAVRRFKPQVIVAVFPADERAGHGQHQASAVIARDVMRLAGPPDRFPGLTAEGLPPWRPRALYRRAWSREDATLGFELGALEPLSGRSVGQLAAASRSQHRSQDMGREQLLGSDRGGLVWLAGGAGVAATEPFSGIDVRLAAIAAELPPGASRGALESRLERLEKAARDLRERLSVRALEATVPALAELHRELDETLETIAGDERAAAVRTLLSEKLAAAEVALTAAAGVAVEAVADREAVAPGEPVAVTTSLWNSGSSPLEVNAVELRSVPGWTVTALAGDSEADARGVRSWRFEALVEGAAAPTLPYFLERTRLPPGDVYDWSATRGEERGLAYQPPPLVARFELELAGRRLTLEREVVHRFADQAVGEVRRPLRAVAALEVRAEPELLLWPLAAAGRRQVAVTLASNVARTLSGEVVVALPAGWSPPPPRRFALAERGSLRLALELERPAAAAAGETVATVTATLADGSNFSRSAPLVDYPHIRPVAVEAGAEIAISSLDLVLPRLGRLGYVRGASDRVPEMLAEVGLEVELLEPRALAAGDFSGFEAIVVGSRAYETEPALARANERLLDFARGGGTVIVQYQQYQYSRGGFAPFPLEIARPHGRVTDETSPVRVLAPEHPVFRHPNAITDEDWDAWVQERGLYFAAEWDPAYEPLLELADPGREAERGALLVARLGRGWYVYTGLSLFRQLPAGVPGAYRLLANLLALGEK